jgi:hemerythrin-like domain-containing protein
MVRDRNLIPLSHDHQHALALCVQIRHALSEATAEFAVQTLATSVISHFEIEMRGHFACEEAVLFPMLAGIEEMRLLIAELIPQHRELTALVDQLRSQPEARLLKSFAELLTRHIRKEERVLFEEAQRLLSREEMDAIGCALLAYRQRIS